MADITPEKRQEFTQLSNEYGDTVDSVNEFSDSDIAGGAFILPGFVEGDAQQGILPRWGKMSYAKLRKPIEDAMAEWNGDGTAQNPGMEARVNAAISAAEAVSVEWQGADGTGGIKKQAQDATSAATTAAGNASSAASTATSAAGTATSAAGAATTAANTANEKAALADQKATLADQKAALADTAATNANTEAGKATTATGNANDAADNANAKATLANNAADAATSAAQSATTAASAATTAAGSANTAASDANSAASAANTAATGASNVNATLSGTVIYVTDRTGTTNSADLKGEQGDTGKGFKIEKTFSTKAALESYNYSTGTTDEGAAFHKNDFVMVQSNQEDPDNARLYQLTASLQPLFIADMSGTIGLPGKTAQFYTGTVSTGSAGTNVQVSVRQDGYDASGNPKYYIDFTIPRGDEGEEPVITAAADGTIYVDGVLLTEVIKNAAASANTAAATATQKATLADTAAQNATSVWNTVTSWFGNDTTGFKHDAESWLSTTQSAWNNWFSDTLSTGVRKVWTTFYNSTTSAWDTWFGTSTANGVQKQWADLKADAQKDHTRAVTDHSTAGDDHTQAASDHTQASTDHNTAAADHTQATTDHSNATTAISYATQQGDYAKAQGDYAKEWGDHPPYIGNGTTGDENYWYIWNASTDQYIKSIYAKGDNLDWESMTPAEKQALADEVLAEIGFDDVPTQNSDKAVKSGGLYNAFALKEDKSNVASVATCQAIVDELT